MTTQNRPGETQPIAFLSVAFRPFFLLGSLWSALALGIWVASLGAGFPIPAHLPAMEWHIHEMLFGFGGAAIAGFLLTAVANWTGRPPVRGVPLAALVLLWCLGRAANLAPTLPPWLVASVDCLFPLCVAILVARELIAAGNRRNLVMVALLLLFGCADLLMYLEMGDINLPPGVGWRLALAIVVGLIALIGARIIPAFTRNWLGRHDLRSPPDEPLALARAAPVVLLAGLAAWAIAPDARGGGWALVVGAALTAARLLYWQGWRTRSDALVLVLHLGYFWMAAGSLLLALATLVPEHVPQTLAIHALTAGAIGTMVLAVMSRVCRGHTGRALVADRLTVAIYAAINLSALVRVAAPFAPGDPMPFIQASAIFWITAYLLFAAWSLPIVLRPRPDGKP